MGLQALQSSGLLFNSNFLAPSSDDAYTGYRGELVLVEGGVDETKGFIKPPLEVLRDAVILSTEKLKFVIGGLDHVRSVATFLQKYRSELASDFRAVFYIVDLSAPVQLVDDEQNLWLIPLKSGVPWNELMDELALEKHDFKGQSAVDKIVTMYQALRDQPSTAPVTSLDQALESTTEQVRETWGAV